MIRQGEIFYAWAKDPLIREAGSSGGFVTGMLIHLLLSGRVDAVSAVRKGADIYDASICITDDPLQLQYCTGSLYCGTLSTVKFLTSYLRNNSNHNLAVVVKGCEAKAIIELSKRNRIDLSNIILIGLNCSGTINPITARKMVAEQYNLNPDSVKNLFFSHGRCIIETEEKVYSQSIEYLEQKGYGRRLCCQRCLTRIPRQCDIVCGDFGVIGEYTKNTTCIEVCSKKGAKILESAINAGEIMIGTADPKGIESRSRVEEIMKTVSQQNLKTQFSDLTTGDEILQKMILDMSRCIKCYQCIEGCPLCVCEDCSIKKPWLVKPGQIPPPFMFHLIRASHIADSCINCGQCEDRCPMEIPNSRYMNALQEELEKLFGYHAGDRPGTPVLAKLKESEIWEHNYGDSFSRIVEAFKGRDDIEQEYS